MNDVPAIPLPRPSGVPDTVSDALLLDCVRDYLMGEKDDILALKLQINVQKLHWMIRTSAWRFLQNQFRDEFLQTTGGRLVRLEQKLLDKFEHYVDVGIKGYTQEGLEYTRDLSPKEAVALHAAVSETNKRLDKIRDGDIDRKAFNANDWMRKLEGIAAKTIDGERTA